MPDGRAVGGKRSVPFIVVVFQASFGGPPVGTVLAGVSAMSGSQPAGVVRSVADVDRWLTDDTDAAQHVDALRIRHALDILTKAYPDKTEVRKLCPGAAKVAPSQGNYSPGTAKVARR